MSIQSASKPKNARAIATGPAATATEISLLDRLSILASVLLTLEQSTTGAAAETPASVAPAGLDAALETSVAADHVANPAAPIEVAHLPETTRADSLFPDGPKGVSHTEQRLAAEASADPLQPMTPSHADAAVAPIARLGSSTSPTLLNIEVVDDKAGSVPLSMENLVVATPVSDVIISSVPGTTFVFTGAASPDNFDVFVGTDAPETVDFTKLEGLVARADPDPEPDAEGEAVNSDDSAPNGIYVNLTADGQTVDTAVGRVTVQAWQLDANGKAEKPLAHLENIDNVTGTVGNDVVVGNAQANTFTYTAADGSANGQSASYGFDIYYGGPGDAGSAANDLGDAVDFSRLGSEESIAAAPGSEQTLLPFHAEGITVDLAQAVTIATVDPETGEATTVTGSLVSTIGAAEPLDLALLAWTAPEDGCEAQSTIEDIVTSGGADAIWGNDADNTVVVTGSGENGPAFFDGRGGSDTVDFSELSLPNGDTGIEIHLNQTNDNVGEPTGSLQSDVVQVSVLSNDCAAEDAAPIALARDVENVVGSRGDDVIEGDCNNNVLAGGGGSDTFVFGDVAVVDGRGVTQVGHDIIRDFRRGGIDDDDQLVFDPRIFNFHDGSSLDWLEQLLTNNQIRDDDEGMIIWIDENNSVTLQNYDLDDDSGHGLGLSAYASWIVFV
ncbi:MAG: calcium-binding protein [Hyphomicrobiaceae bacterium]